MSTTTRRWTLRRVLPGALGLGALLGAAPLAAQQQPPLLESVDPLRDRGGWTTPPADSARALGAARSAQARFELVRRNNLPWTHDRGSGPCDERIGRFCLWHGSGESKWTPPDDPEPTVRAREVLIARLDTTAAVIPGDTWVAGQRVRYLVEAERFDEAVAAAEACRSREPGWCDALRGYAHHSRGDFVSADSVFDAALAAMDDEERARWTDLSALLDPPDVRRYRRLPEAERAAFEERFWRLAEPLYLLPGNDRRTEHLSRHVLDRLQDRARQTEGIAWGWDLREILIRYGAPAGWERIRPGHLGMQADGMITRYPPGSRSFEPRASFVHDPGTIDPGEWELNPQRARSSYAPRYAGPVELPEFQVAAFRRGDSAVVAGALRLRPDSLAVRHPAEFALAVVQDEAAPPLLVRQFRGDSAATLRATVATAPAVVSVEAFAEEARRVARARFSLRLDPLPARGIAVSDLLLVRTPDDLPDSLAAAIPRMRAGTEVRAGERVGIFWEIYGLAEADLPLGTAVHLSPEDAGLLRRLAERMRILQPQTPLNVRWQEVPADAGAVFPRSLAVQIPELRPGRYTLHLTLTPRDGEPVVARRTLTVVE